MSIEIIPPGASAVVTEKGHGRGYGYGDCDGDRYRNHDRFAEVRRDVKDEGCEGIKATKDARYDVVQEVNQSFKDTGNQIERGFTAASLAACRSDDKVCEGFDSLRTSVRDGTDVTKDSFAQSQKQVSDAATATLVGFKDLQALTYQVEGRSLLEAAKNTNNLANQATSNFNLISVQNEKIAAAAQLEAQKNAAAAQLEAQKNAASIAAQLAECCCELKELIRCEGQKTRELINEQEVDRLRERASKAENQLALLQLHVKH